MVKCPAHADGQASLSVAPGGQPGPGQNPQPVTLHCHAGCKVEDILAADGIEWSEVCNPIDTTATSDEVWTPGGPASHVYDYKDEDGRILFQALRVPKAGGGKT